MHDPEVTACDVKNDAYYSDDAFVEWQYPLTSFESDQIVIHDFDIHYVELFSPPDGATYKADEISDSNPIVFEWTDGGRSDILFYNIKLCPEGTEEIWSEQTDSVTVSFNGILNDETKITPGTYKWELLSCFEEHHEGWEASCGWKTLIIQ